MLTPDQQRMDAISDALVRLIRKQDDLSERLGRIEHTLQLSPLAPPPVPVSASYLAPDVDDRGYPMDVIPQAASSGAPPLPPVPPSLEAPPPLPPPKEGLESNIGLKLMNRVGALTLVLGIAFLFKSAVDSNWIGPSGRVMLALLAGFATIGGADVFFRRGQRVFAQGLTAVGASIVYIALYSAFGFYHLIPQEVALVSLVAITGLTAALALRYDSVAISALALISGYLTLLLLSSGEDHPVFLFAYLLLLAAGAMAVARIKAWRVLELLSFVPTVLLFFVWYSAHFKPEKHLIAVAFLAAFYALYTFASIPALFFITQFFVALALGAVEEKSPEVYFPLAIAVAVAGLVVADWKRWRTAVTLAFGSFWWVSGWMAAPLIRNGHEPGPFFPYFTLGYVLFLAWTPWWLLVRRQAARAHDMAVLALNPMVYFGIAYWLLNPNYHQWMGLFAVGLAAVQLGLGYQLWSRQSPEGRSLPAVLLAIGVAFGFLTLAAPLQFSAWRITMAWALEGAALTWIGSKFNERRMVWAGTVLFVLTSFRLLTLDAWIYPSSVSYSIILNDRFFTFAVAAVCLWLAAMWLEREEGLRLGAYIGGHFVMLWALTQEVLGWVGRSTEQANLASVETISVSILYALYALLFIGIGVATRSVVNRIAGLVLIAVVVLKLYLFDVWQVGTAYRTIAFVALGMLLLSTSFLYSRYREQIGGWLKKDDAPLA